MEDQVYITEVKAWLTTEVPEVATTVPVANEEAPRLCRGCSEPLPRNRKMYHNDVCKGRWMGTHNRNRTVKPVE